MNTNDKPQPNPTKDSPAVAATPAEGQTASNVGNPSRAAQVAAHDKATAPHIVAKKPKSEEPTRPVKP